MILRVGALALALGVAVLAAVLFGSLPWWVCCGIGAAGGGGVAVLEHRRASAGDDETSTPVED